MGIELLGPEPLKMLIDGILFDDEPRADAGFDQFARDPAKHRFQLLGTTTNLTRGRLDLLSHEKQARLTEGLLASSAFPAVFRPRWSWEVFANPDEPAQYCDGGVMDNLPLDSVVEYLADRRGKVGPRFPRRPDVPHLIVAASLEPEDFRQLTDAEIDRRCGSWIDLHRRAAELRYNGKIDKFSATQTHIRRIIDPRKGEPGFDPKNPRLPLNLEVAVVKAKWLCSTFAFHPMLGFRRADQAASIAHGCAATFQRLGEIFFVRKKEGESNASVAEREALARKRRDWAKKKNIAFEQIIPADQTQSRKLTATQLADGVCWYRRATVSDGSAGPDPLCPDSAGVVRSRSLNPGVPDDASRRERMAIELNAIYEACGCPGTHSRR